MSFANFVALNMKFVGEKEKSVKKIIDCILTEFHDVAFKLNSLLADTGYSEDYIRSFFRQYTGKTPNEFLTETRIRHAKHLIETYKDNLSLSEISEMCGYTDYCYFSRKFRSVTGVSPKEYKNDAK